MTNPPPSSFPEPISGAHNPQPNTPQPGTPQSGFPQQGYQQPGYPPPGYQQPQMVRPPNLKTSTKSGKILTAIGAFFAILAITATVMATVSFASLEQDLGALTDELTNGAEIVNEETLIVATADSTYTIFPQQTYSTDSGNTTQQNLNGASMRARITVVNVVTGAEVSVTPVTSSGFISAMANSVLQPVGEFKTTEAGEYSIVVYPEPTADEALTVVSSKLTSTLWDAVSKGFIWGGVATLTGFLATVFLIWGIILWATRSSRGKKLARFQAQSPQFGH